MAWQPQYIDRTENRKPKDVIKANVDWNALWAMAKAQGNNNVDGIKELMQRMTTVETDVLSAVQGSFTTGVINDTDFFTDGIVTGPKIATNSILTEHYSEGSIVAEKFAASAISTAFYNSLHQENFQVASQLIGTKTYTLSKACKTLLFITPGSGEATHFGILFAGQALAYSYRGVGSGDATYIQCGTSPECWFYYSNGHLKNVTVSLAPDGRTLTFSFYDSEYTSASTVAFDFYVIGLKEAI